MSGSNNTPSEASVSTTVSNAISLLNGSSGITMPHTTATNSLTSLDINETLFCWLCRDTAEIMNLSDFNNVWVSACNCDGIRKYAHHKCLLTFIINSKYYNPQWEIKCSWCNAPYLITVDAPSFLYRIQTYFDKLLGRLVPSLISIGAILSVVTLSYSYSDTLLRFIHAREEFFEIFDGIFYDGSYTFAEGHLILIPFSLIYFESYNWEHFLATKIIHRVLKSRSTQFQNLLMMDEIFNQDTLLNVENNRSHLSPNNTNPTIQRNTNPTMLEFSNTSNPNSHPTLEVDISSLDVYPRQKRNVVGFVVTGLALPFFSHILASVLFPRVNHNLLRTYLGWTCIQAIRGAFRIVYQIQALKTVTSIKIFNRNQSTSSHFNL